MKQKNDQALSNDPLGHYAEAVCIERHDECAIVGKIGNGNSASVYQVSMNGQRAALKVYYPKFLQGDSREVEQRRVVDQMSLKGHGHPNLIDFIDAGSVLDTCYLLMEYVPWKSLDQFLKLVDRSEIGAIISKVASAAEFIDERGFVHRDIKPANILVSQDSKDIKLLDLGVMRPITATDEQNATDHGYALPFVATAQYSSPAYLFREDSSTEEMWKALTFYQLGAVLHDLIMGEPIFAKEMRSQNRYRVAAAVLLTNPEVRGIDIPSRLIALARNCLLKADDARLRRVSWSSFRERDEVANDQIRANLGLGDFRAPAQMNMAANQRQEERLRIRLDQIRDKLLDFGQHVLRVHGFPQAVSLKFVGDSPRARFVSLTFPPSNADQVETNLMLVLRLSILEESPSQCEVALGTYLLRKGDTVCEFDEGTFEFLWNSTLNEFELDEEQLIEVMAEAFLRHYANADQQLARFEDPSFEPRKMSVEVG